MEFLLILGGIAVAGLVVYVAERICPGSTDGVFKAMEEQREIERVRRMSKPTDAEMKADIQRFKTNWNQVVDKSKRL